MQRKRPQRSAGVGKNKGVPNPNDVHARDSIEPPPCDDLDLKAAESEINFGDHFLSAGSSYPPSSTNHEGGGKSDASAQTSEKTFFASYRIVEDLKLLSLRRALLGQEVGAGQDTKVKSSRGLDNAPDARPGSEPSLESARLLSAQPHLLASKALNDQEDTVGSTCGLDSSPEANPASDKASSEAYSLSDYLSLETSSSQNWIDIQYRLPDDWKWDVEYNVTYTKYGSQRGCWTCTPMEPDKPAHYPLAIANAPLVLPVEYHWPPVSGVAPPPDPRPAAPIDCRAEVSLNLIKDIFLTFEGRIGFYFLINGLLQVVVPEDFDATWASSHLPHKYGGLKVCYIEQTLEPTMLPARTGTTERTFDRSSLVPLGTSGSSPIARTPAQSLANIPSLKLNDFIEARPKSNHRSEKFSGRVGLKVSRTGITMILMSTHVITEAILAKSYRDSILGRKHDERVQKLEDDWNEHVEIWAGGENICQCGTIHQSFDKEAGIYPNGFNHDITLIKPAHGTLCAKSIKCSGPSDILVVGEGIFLNQKATAGDSKSLKHHDAATWKDLVSRAILYRIYPDFDPPNGHSGTVLYADGIRTDGTEGSGVVGFQSFVQRSGHVQNFEMEGDALERRLRAGRVAFYGAFEVPAELKKYHIY
ncbi:hypothetical protein BKA58DRAFT_419428 [Alternaria rosae]|uniref:uncharacterized protein n=1 Tax=Alternaria rosae TaxID=1187941 RepID=UPI001E8D928B|nr:uncharacterized protein BKA58DRAFT_419428 [Alternaria rosae]KAH6876043.1 hypothetical protein BKA58DRAFT_419428 [Alternaria rosae]